MLLVRPTLLNWFIFSIYLLMSVLRILLTPQREKAWGVVYDTRTANPIDLAVVEIRRAADNRVLKTRLSDYEGRFSFIPPIGKYILRAAKDGYKFPSQSKKKFKEYESPYYGETFEITEKKKVINQDVPMDPTGKK